MYIHRGGNKGRREEKGGGKGDSALKALRVVCHQRCNASTISISILCTFVCVYSKRGGGRERAGGGAGEEGGGEKNRRSRLFDLAAISDVMPVPSLY